MTVQPPCAALRIQGTAKDLLGGRRPRSLPQFLSEASHKGKRQPCPCH